MVYYNSVYVTPSGLSRDWMSFISEPSMFSTEPGVRQAVRVC